MKIFTSCCFYQQVLPPGIRRLSENKLIVPEAAPRQRDILAGLPPASFSSKSRRIEQLFTSINTKILLKIRRSDVQTFRRSDVQTFRRSDVQTFRRSDVHTLRRSHVHTGPPSASIVILGHALELICFRFASRHLQRYLLQQFYWGKNCFLQTF